MRKLNFKVIQVFLVIALLFSFCSTRETQKSFAEANPEIAINKTILNFGRCFITDQPNIRFKIVNMNHGSMTVSLKPSAIWIKLSVTDFVKEEKEIEVSLAVSGLKLGIYEEAISVTSDGGNLTIPVLVNMVEKKTRVKLTLDNPVGEIDGIPQKAIEAAPFILGGKEYLPLRFVMEAFGAKVEYEQITNELNPSAFIKYIRINSTTIDIEYSTVDNIIFVDNRPLINNFQFVTRGSRAFVPIEFFTQTLGVDIFTSAVHRTYMIEY